MLWHTYFFTMNNKILFYEHEIIFNYSYYSILNPTGIYDAEVWHYLSVIQERTDRLHRILELGSGVGAMAESFLQFRTYTRRYF